MSRPARLGLGDVVAERFRLMSEIGEGGMGRVFHAEDMLFERPVAVKLISRRLAQDPEFRARFEREARAAQRANHPHVLPVWDHGSEGEYLYLATRLCDTDLAALIDERGQLDPEEALDILGPIAWALDWAHGRGVIHRDVKPENVLLVTGMARPHAYLGDFGMARVATSVTLTQLGHLPGLSPAYAAPEQWMGERPTPATDQYALAATLYCCLAGHAPFWPTNDVEELRVAHLEEVPPALGGTAAPRLTQAHEALVRAMAKAPEDRYESCQELIDAVAAATAAPGDGDRWRRDETDPEHPLTARRRGARRITPHQPSTDAPVEEALAPTAPDAPAVPPEEPPRAATGARARRPTGAEQPRRAPPSRDLLAEVRRPPVIALLALLAVGVVVLLAMALSGGGGGDRPRPPGPPGVVVLAVGRGPSDLAAGDGGLWVANQRDGTVSRIDPASRRVVARSIPAVRAVSQLAVGNGQVLTFSEAGEARALNAADGRALGPPVALAFAPWDVALGDGVLWLANGTDGSVHRIAVDGGGRLGADAAEPVGAGVRSIAIGRGGTWVASPNTGHLYLLEHRRGGVRQERHIGEGTTTVVVLDGYAWVADPRDGLLTRFEIRSFIAAPDGGEPEHVGVRASRNGVLLAGEGKIVYVDLDTSTATVIDPITRDSRRLPSLRKHASAAAVAGHRVWIADPRANTVTAIPF